MLFGYLPRTTRALSIIPTATTTSSLIHRRIGRRPLAKSFLLRSSSISTARTIQTALFSSSSSSSDMSSIKPIEISIADALALHKNNNDDTDQKALFLDGSWWMPNAPQTARERFLQGPRIAGARFWDIDELCDNQEPHNANLPHMMPPADLQAAAMTLLGVTDVNHPIVLYGQSTTCPFVWRAWFQLVAYGHENARVLQGSLDDWRANGGAIDETSIQIKNDEELTGAQVREWLQEQKKKEHVVKMYPAVPPKQKVVLLEEMKDLVEQTKELEGQQDNAASNPSSPLTIIDVRSAERFQGLVEEPRPGLRLGHMPGARNLPFPNVLQPPDDKESSGGMPTLFLKSREELQQILEIPPKDDDQSTRIVASCGSGATACIVAAAFIKCGHDPNQVAIYDGSWTEWGGEPDTLIVNNKSKGNGEEEEDDDENNAKKRTTTEENTNHNSKKPKQE